MGLWGDWAREAATSSQPPRMALHYILVSSFHSFWLQPAVFCPRWAVLTRRSPEHLGQDSEVKEIGSSQEESSQRREWSKVQMREGKMAQSLQTALLPQLRSEFHLFSHPRVMIPELGKCTEALRGSF